MLAEQNGILAKENVFRNTVYGNALKKVGTLIRKNSVIRTAIQTIIVQSPAILFIKNIKNMALLTDLHMRIMFWPGCVLDDDIISVHSKVLPIPSG